MHSDPSVASLKHAATNGSSQRGPYFDMGVLCVIGEIERTGRFVPNPLRAMVGLSDVPSVLQPDERAALEAELQSREWTTEQGIAYGAGIEAAEMRLAAYRA